MYQSQWVEPALPMVTTLGPWGLATQLEWMTSNPPTSSSWSLADRAVYMPLWVPTTCVIRRVWWANGATTTGGATVEVGVYRSSDYIPTTKVISGSAVQGTASQVQFVDVTDTPIGPGLYYIAVVMSSTTNTTAFISTGNASASRIFVQTSANPLPATATPAQATSIGVVLCGFATTASP